MSNPLFRTAACLATTFLIACGNQGPAPRSPDSPAVVIPATSTAPNLSVGTAGRTPHGGLVVTGTIQGSPIPDKTPVQVVWVVSAGTPDKAHVFGDGETLGNSFHLELPGPPPPAALNSGSFGVGLVVLVRQRLPSGGINDRELLDRSVIGAADRDGILFLRRPTPDVEWLRRFENGYSCGHGAPPTPGSHFESFEVESCSSLKIRLGPLSKLEPVNWT